MKRRIVLTFPKALVNQPIIHRLVKDFDLVLNILRAQITPEEEGKMVLELEGSRHQIEQGLGYLKAQKVAVEPIAKDIRIDSQKCIHCGVCVAVCPQDALTMSAEDARLVFDRNKCILCELCVPVCPVKAIKSEL